MIFITSYSKQGLPGGSEVKASTWNAGDLGSIPGSGKIPWRRQWQLTRVLLPGESHGGRILVGNWEQQTQSFLPLIFSFQSSGNIHLSSSMRVKDSLFFFFSGTIFQELLSHSCITSKIKIPLRMSNLKYINACKSQLPLQTCQREDVFLITVAEASCQSLSTKRASQSYPQDQLLLPAPQDKLHELSVPDIPRSHTNASLKVSLSFQGCFYFLPFFFFFKVGREIKGEKNSKEKFNCNF